MLRTLGPVVVLVAVTSSAVAGDLTLHRYMVTSRDQGSVTVNMGRHDYCSLSSVLSGGFNSVCAVTQEADGWALTAIDPPAPDPWTGESQECVALCFSLNGGHTGGGQHDEAGGGGLAARLTSGAYSVSTTALGRTYPGTFTLTVDNGVLTGKSEWACCPGPRVDPLQGRIEGDRVIIERDCTGQGAVGPCHQVYTGALSGNLVSGRFTHNGADHGVWSLQVP